MISYYIFLCDILSVVLFVVDMIYTYVVSGELAQKGGSMTILPSAWQPTTQYDILINYHLIITDDILYFPVWYTISSTICSRHDLYICCKWWAGPERRLLDFVTLATCHAKAKPPSLTGFPNYHTYHDCLQNIITSSVITLHVELKI